MIPKKLQPGHHIRVVSPSRSLGIVSEENRQIARSRLEQMGYRVTYSKHAEEIDEFGSSSVASRLEDLHEAFADTSVDAVLATIGGFNCNQLLRGLDYELIRSNPKIFCGYSDITALGSAIFAKTGLVTYSGPAFSTFGMELGNDYTVDYFQRCLAASEPIEITPPETWSDDRWWMDQSIRTFIPNEGPWAIQDGEAEGMLIGGNLCTLNLLHGTEYMPSLKGAILLVEDDYAVDPLTFDRDLQSLLHQPDFAEVRALLIGRFQKKSGMTKELLSKTIATKPELRGLPVAADLDFGHTSPLFTFPIGGKGRIVCRNGHVRFDITEH